MVQSGLNSSRLNLPFSVGGGDRLVLLALSYPTILVEMLLSPSASRVGAVVIGTGPDWTMIWNWQIVKALGVYNTVYHSYIILAGFDVSELTDAEAG